MTDFLPREFLDFLIKAEKATYASQGDNASVTPLLEGSRQLEFQEGPFLYRDVYFGMSYFVGQEVVYYQGQPIWSMCYSGGVDKEFEMDFVKKVYAFLRKALRNVSADHPFRGPKEFVEGDYIYRDSNSGELDEFTGKETITFANKFIYSLNYSGGFIR
ncbi:DUF5680 domain-containing protein [Thermoflavimicrobium dichotomicum]|uniref:DUF5680 domain-containing protein n=1 Tax=Thermoflavimicrobium dichotomicum TaxID=46223 RepID=A0A1I3T3C7_9BACL|nr:DUF5680 domain-containing protein [Thermoflavimicrobium dichotomicum]SFJ64176.1 hypothetical protein SAMN05421852_1152 [Thermoflavimicrobium dichotomicum]